MNEIYSGYNITLNKEENRAYKGKMLKIEGNSKQETREGYNKLPPMVEKTTTFQGRTYTSNGKGSLSVTGSATGSGATAFDLEKEIILGKENLYVHLLNNYATGAVGIRFLNGNTRVFEIVPTSANMITDIGTTYAGQTITAIQIYQNGSNNFDMTIQPMICTSNSSFEFEQYGASPSIDYQSEVESVGDNINEFDISQVNGFVNSSVDNEIITSSALTGNYQYVRFNFNEISLKATEKCEISMKMKIDSGTYSGIINSVQCFNGGTSIGDSTKLTNPAITNDYQNYKFTITPSENTTLNRLLVQLGQNASETIISIKDIKISKRETGPYSPYGQGSVGIKQANKNFLDMTNAKGGTSGGITCTVNNNGSYSYVGTATSTAVNVWLLGVYSSSDTMPVLFTLKAGTYYVKDCRLYNKKSNVGGTKDGEIITLTEDTNITGVRAVNAVVGTNYNETLYPIIALSNAPVDFIQHQSQTKALYTQQPFRAIGDVKDRFVKQNGVWYEEHNIERKISNGTENWALSTELTNVVRFNLRIVGANYDKAQLSNMFKYDTGYNGDYEHFYIWGENLYVFINKNVVSNLEEWKTWLSTNNVTIDYVLATPTLIECTPAQSVILESLENIQLYNGANYIYTTDDIQPLLTLELYNMIEDYDLYVSNDGYFGIPGTDIKFLVNFYESNLPTMPEAVEASVRAAGRDGDYVLNTTYEPLPFEIVCYTEDNLTPTQKKEIESKVNRFLNSIKNRTKRIAFEKGEKFYNVKYNGLLTTTNYPAHLKFSIPLKSSESFGKDAYQKVLSGNSTEVSDTVEEVGALITIYGPATLPIIALNDYSMEYDTAILEGARVEIDTAKSTATHINSDGVKTNVMRHYNHQFPKIQPGENTLKVLSGVDDENNVTVKWNDLKL